MTWNLFEKPLMATRRRVATLNERPQEITPQRWGAMQLQLQQDHDSNRTTSQSTDDSVFWVYDVAN